ncbi:sugar ABC transporter ATP-binding protein [Martelella mediterranea]|uniref:Monosaccharide ABC transporter ATP-binding protein (CUT2 family) n=1 Tax=Martelella mediterranea TaxID=293089 RepID=A0A4R3NXF8_9HYPH|nr:sugar ABC transporter ATP-binding protein [Martelella mediterranea]TCT44646.1 monosaccharide ABC transporter ATP-binding protein (CUT2 family) [Martelella mediterranea]
MSSAKAEPVLEMQGISKTFGPMKALSGVAITAYGGEVHALMGENGAGKSTLMKILSGAYTPDRGGSIKVGGETVPHGKPKAAKSMGVAVIYQELSLAPNLTVAENIFLGNERASHGIVNRGQMRTATQPILDRLGVDFKPSTPVSDLSLGERQLVEIARALSANARIIVMDEPTTSLTSRETDRLFDVIAGLKAENIAIIYISHRMEEIYRLADRCSVLRDGSYIGTLQREELNADRLISMMVGRELSSFYKKEHVEHDDEDIVLEVQNMSDGHKVKNCSFTVRKGEVLGVSGLVGSGRTELARLIYGADKATSGKVFLNGKDVTPQSPSVALKKGIVYLTEDRKKLGLFLDMTIADNINICVMAGDSGTAGIRNFQTARERAENEVERLSIRTQSPFVNVGSLSGGNQQKVLLGRLLEVSPKVIILDEPTRGVDVGAKSEIYRLIDMMARQGMAVVMISSELPEIINVADRALVMREGAIAGEVTSGPGQPIDQEAIMRLSTGTRSAA